MTTDMQEIPTSIEAGSRKWANQWGADDASAANEMFFPEQVGAWLRSDYAEGFLSVQPDNESAKLWMAKHLRRQDEEEREMDEREHDEREGAPDEWRANDPNWEAVA